MLEEKESIVALATALLNVRQCGDAFAIAYRALEATEESLFQHKDAFGVQSIAFQQGAEEFVLLCNTVAMRYLQRHSNSSDEDDADKHACDELGFDKCHDLLTRAEQHTRSAGYLRSIPAESESDVDPPRCHLSRRRQLRLATLNNLACFHKQNENPLAAVRFLEKVLSIQLKSVPTSITSEGSVETRSHFDDDVNSDHALALTHLNLCAVLSQMDRHTAASQHAQSAITLLSSARSDTNVDIKMLLIARYNLAVELEHLYDIPGALAQCERALTITNAVHRPSQHSGDSTIDDVTRLLKEMILAHKGAPRIATARKALSPRYRAHQRQRQRPPSPRTLRQTT